MFLASFYCYLQHDNKNDFVIDLDNVWKWLGFNQKSNAKYALEKILLLTMIIKSLLLNPQEQRTRPKGVTNVADPPG